MIRWILLVAALLAAPGAKAVECPVMAGASSQLAQVDAEARIEFIRGRLQVDSKNLTIWKWTWVGLFGGIAVGQAVAAKTDSFFNRQKWAMGAAVSFVGGVATIIGKKRAIGDGATLADMPNGATPGATCFTLAKAEEFLMRDAEDEEKGRGIVQHLENIGLNLIAGLILGIAWHQWGNGAIQFVAGSALGEVQIFTQPMGAVAALKDYQAGQLAPPVSLKGPHSTPASPGYSLALAF